ncbi:MAG: PP0621 family protein [Leptothrix sp. (in: b-proteobacteria)]
MTRLLWIALLGLLVWWLVRGASRSSREADRSAAATDRAPAAPPKTGPVTGRGVQTMARCARCGLHLPAAEALMAGDLAYCCSAHRDAGPQRPARD